MLGVQGCLRFIVVVTIKLRPGCFANLHSGAGVFGFPEVTLTLNWILSHGRRTQTGLCNKYGSKAFRLQGNLGL